MKSPNPVLFLALGSAATLLHADQADDAIVAAMKLANASSYSWTATVNQNSHTSEIQGKTSSEGYSLLTFTGYSTGNSSARSSASPTKSGSSGGTNAVFLGDTKYVVQTDEGWTNPGDLSSPAAQSGTGGRNSGGGRGGTTGIGGARGRGGRGMGGSGQRSRSGAGNQNSASPSSANPKLPPGINLPHEELAIVAANYTDIHLEDGALAGKLTQSAADLLLVSPGSTKTPPEGSAGTFRLWVNHDAITKYELKLTADKAPGDTGIKGSFSETITVEVTDIGTTKVDFPEAAKRKLGG